MKTAYGFIAANRFGYGALPSEASKLVQMSKREAHAYLNQQLTPYELVTSKGEPLWRSEDALRASAKSQLLKKRVMQQGSANEDEVKTARLAMVREAAQLAEQIAYSAIKTKQPLQARLLDFFSNHFSVNRTNFIVSSLAPTKDIEAVLPNLNGHFADMLIAVTQHPAMLMYLNNERSIGPNSLLAKSKLAKRNNLTGLNENLAREILELHTMGASSGYTQDDVVSLAKGISGWSIGFIQRDEAPEFKYRHLAHEPGEHLLLSKHYKTSKGTAKQGEAMLSDLAIHPATATHLSYKLARHFISDEPTDALIDDMKSSWIETQAHIPSVMQTLIKHEDSWLPKKQKYKTPRDFVLSACRSCAFVPKRPALFQSMEILGQGMYKANSPAGYGDLAQDWLGASALTARIDWANHFSKAEKQIVASHNMSVMSLAKAMLGPDVDKQLMMHLNRAESAQQSLAMLLLSPDFQRR
uniref:DUF1800 domain-containing protein n=1 Tax=Ningiella ruwaisensis TaxID=2364274 RepID=UPI00109FE489|nr:DUF1800 domain-containing protein [Ningiella ruwaisensis]